MSGMGADGPDRDKGAFDLPYIPTYTDAAAIRPADICYSGTPFADRYNPERGSLFFDYEAPEGQAGVYIMSAKREDTTAQWDRIFIYSGFLRVNLQSNTPSIQVTGNFLGRHRVMFSWDSGTVMIFVDGEIRGVYPSAMPDGLDSAGLFNQPSFSGAQGYGVAKQFWLDDQPVTEQRGVELTTL